eukprot:1188449-Prorocentrum_minimum.AAC.5
MSTGSATLATVSRRRLIQLEISTAPVRMIPARFTSVDCTAKSKPRSTSTRRASIRTIAGWPATAFASCSTCQHRPVNAP